MRLHKLILSGAFACLLVACGQPADQPVGQPSDQPTAPEAAEENTSVLPEPAAVPEPAGEVCGGIAGIACSANEYCRKPEGTCGAEDVQGICTDLPEPGSPCTADYRPVCGCDGTTYSNECGAHTAGVNIDYRGECKAEATAESPE